MNSDLTEKLVYSSSLSQERYDYNIAAKGPDLKIGNDIKLIKAIEDKIKKEKKSPEVIVREIEANISAVTIRNYINSGNIF